MTGICQTRNEMQMTGSRLSDASRILYVALRSLAVFVVTSYAIDGWAKKMMGGLLVERIQALGGLFSGNPVPLLQSSIL